MNPILFACDTIDGDSRVMGVGLNYDVAFTQDASTGDLFIGDGLGGSNYIHRFTSELAWSAGAEGDGAGAAVFSFDALAVNGSVLFANGTNDNGAGSLCPGVSAWSKAALTYTDGRLTGAASPSTAYGVFASCANAGTGAYYAGKYYLPGTDAMLVGSVASTGVPAWAQLLAENGAYLIAATLYDVALNSSNSNVTIGGEIGRASDGDYRGLVAAFNSSGTFQWGFELHGVGLNRVGGLCCDASGNTYVALGGSTNFSGTAVPLVAKLDSAGAVTATLNFDSAQVTDLLGIYLQGTTLIVVGKHASGGLAVFLTDTSLATPTGTRLYDTAGTMLYPRNVRISYYGGFYFFNFAANGGNLCVAKVSADVLRAPVATFGNRFQAVAFTPSSAAYTLTATATGANYTTYAIGAFSADYLTGQTSLTSPSLTDYFAS